MSRATEIKELTRSRILLFLREPEAVFWVFVFPVILAVVLGFAFSEEEVLPSRISLPVGAEADALARALAASPDLEVERFEDEALAIRRLAKGAVQALVRPGSPPEIRYDPGRPEGALARLRVLEAWRDAMHGARPPEMKEHTEKEIGSRYIDFLFPGLLGMNLMGTGIWSIGFAVADFRQKKLLRRFLVTPMRKPSFLFSFLLARKVFMVAEVLALLLFGVFILGVPFSGSVLSFLLLAVTGTLTFAGLGLLVASRARTIEGVSGLMNFVMMPMWLCSGVFFSYERFPEFLHPIFKAIPLTALNDGLRAVMLDGAPFTAILGDFAIVAAWGLVSFVCALKIFRWS